MNLKQGKQLLFEKKKTQDCLLDIIATLFIYDVTDFLLIDTYRFFFFFKGLTKTVVCTYEL